MKLSRDLRDAPVIETIENASEKGLDVRVPRQALHDYLDAIIDNTAQGTSSLSLDNDALDALIGQLIADKSPKVVLVPGAEATDAPKEGWVYYWVQPGNAYTEEPAQKAYSFETEEGAK